MKTSVLISTVLLLAAPLSADGTALDRRLPLRGLSIAAPRPDRLPDFVRFMNTELAPRRVNTLILRVDYNYEYRSHPELRDQSALSNSQVKEMVGVARKHGIRLIPQVNLLGHQSWASRTQNLLRHYPQFDETPWVQMPEKYAWPNPDGLYCKSYCPRHPEVHEVVFALVDEIVTVFETDAFHAGMDEVFYLGDDKCPRCKGRNKAKLFADEVKRIRDHLAAADRQLWIWGDRLLDGETTGLGMWEASTHQTHPAIDLIPRDVMICDWHYERAEPTAAYFAMKGFQVATCSWNKAPVAVAQLHQMLRLKQDVNSTLSGRMQGVVHTVWSSAGAFLDGFYDDKAPAEQEDSVRCFRALYDEIATVK